MAGRRRAHRPFLVVLAGVNGAGKSSVAGALLADQGLSWFNPDTFARELALATGLSALEASSRAWHHGRALLESAIARRTNHAFETTLGGATIPALLQSAERTHDVHMIYVGLSSVDQHLARVRSRVAAGGHEIPDTKIRERWITSRANLVRLLPHFARLQVFDNSVEIATGLDIPDPFLTLEMEGGNVVVPRRLDARALAAIPEWARPIVQAAFECSRDG
jgi:predicted ABC-type ATPase